MSLRLALLFLATATVAARPAGKLSSTAIQIDYDVRVPMRDGLSLSTDIYRPKGDARVPVILVRTPYDNGVAAWVAEGKRSAPPALKALIPTVTPPDPDRNFPVQFGAYEPSTFSWLAAISGKTMQDISEHDLRGAYSHRPLYEADRLLGRTMKVWRDWLDHPTRDAYWEAQSNGLKDVSIPMLHISSWYDDVLVGTTENYTITRDKPNQSCCSGRGAIASTRGGASRRSISAPMR